MNYRNNPIIKVPARPSYNCCTTGVTFGRWVSPPSRWQRPSPRSVTCTPCAHSFSFQGTHPRGLNPGKTYFLIFFEHLLFLKVICYFCAVKHWIKLTKVSRILNIRERKFLLTVLFLYLKFNKLYESEKMKSRKTDF